MEPPDGRLPSAADDTLARETALIKEAHGLMTTNPTEALAQIDEHAHSFPEGWLRTEREFAPAHDGEFIRLHD